MNSVRQLKESKRIASGLVILLKKKKQLSTKEI